jgi:hypothetical protein
VFRNKVLVDISASLFNFFREFELKDIGIEEYIRWSNIHPCLALLGIPSLSQI